MKTTITVRVSDSDRKWLVEQAEQHGDAIADRIRETIKHMRHSDAAADRVIAELRVATAAAADRVIAELHALARPRPTTSKPESTGGRT